MDIELKGFNPLHCNDYFQLFSSENVCRYMDIMPFSNESDFDRFLSSTLENNKAGRSKRFSIFHEERFCGTITLYAILWHQKRASVGYALKEEFRNRGIMSRALSEIEKIAGDLGIHRLQATVLQENSASQRLLEKCGFKFEGVLKDYEIWEGRGFVDLMMYSRMI